jgi:hypothetical protein
MLGPSAGSAVFGRDFSATEVASALHMGHPCPAEEPERAPWWRSSRPWSVSDRPARRRSRSRRPRTAGPALRQAILDANVTAGTDTIAFAIPGTGVPRITPATALPAITDPLTLDGTTQAPAGRVELDGQATLFSVGLTLAAGDSPCAAS